MPKHVEFFDPRSGKQYKKVVLRDDQRNRFVLYLECRSKYGSFDFKLNVGFEIGKGDFFTWEYHDKNMSERSALVDAYEGVLDRSEGILVQQFFGGPIVLRDQYNVPGQAAAVGPYAQSEGNEFSQAWDNRDSTLNLELVASELAELKEQMHKKASQRADYVSTAAVATAEEAARRGDRAGVLMALKSAGKWTLDLAKEIGVNVVVKAIESSIGLS